MSGIHPLISAIADDDPDLKKVMLCIRKPVLPVKEVFVLGPFKRARTYEDIASGLLPSHTISGQRFVHALDFAKYLVALERKDKAEGRQHPWAKNRPRHNRHPHATAA